jgi:hypothetical protein
MISRSLLFTAVILFTATAVEHAPALWRGPPQMLVALDDETRNWAKALKNKFGGPCCDLADGFPAEWDMDGTVDDTSAMNTWDASNARSGYRVRLADGKWHDVPNYALIDPKTNKLGYAVVWLIPWMDLQIHCFLPGAGG